MGDTILDPFLGSGTTAKVSLDNGRKCIGYEISPVFVDTSFQRCGDDMIQERVKVSRFVAWLLDTSTFSYIYLIYVLEGVIFYIID